MNGAWMRDPLRAGMEARVRGTQRLALGAALTLAFFALALKLCAAMEGAAVIALVGAGCAALLLAGAFGCLAGALGFRKWDGKEESADGESL